MSVDDLIQRLLKRVRIDLGDIPMVREYLENDSILHHEVAEALASSQEEIERLRKALETLRPLLNIEFTDKIADDRRITVGVSGAAMSLCTKMTVGDLRAARALASKAGAA